MKFWKRWMIVLAAALLLALLAACGASGPAASEQPGSSTGTSGSAQQPGGSETGKDPEQPGTGKEDPDSGAAKDPAQEPGGSGTEDENNKKTEEQKAIEATVKALNTVRAEYGLKTPLVLDAQACAIARQMAQVQLDGMTGKYTEKAEGSEYSKKCTEIRSQKVQNRASIGFGAVYNAYPIEKTYRRWVNSTNQTSAERNKTLIQSRDAAFVGVGVVYNPDTTSEYKYMVVVMTY